MTQFVKTQIPVLIGEKSPVMCMATITADENTVTISMVADGPQARDLVAFMAATEPQALAFVAIPVTPHDKRFKENL